MESDQSKLSSHSHNDNLRSEIARLQERESTLTHLLNLEKERRVRAEHLVEIEHQACFELGHRLTQQRKAESTSLVHQSLSNDPKSQSKRSVLASYEGSSKAHENGVYDTETVVCSIDFKDAVNDTVNTKANGDVLTLATSDSSVSIMSPALFGDDFASSVFSQLPTDLQHMLGLGDAQETNTQEAFSKAVAAVSANDPVELKKYIALLGPDGLRDHEGISLLQTSCEKGHESCIHVLVENGCDPNTVTNDNSPLHLCAKYGHTQSLNMLLKFGANPNTGNGNGQTPLFLSLKKGHEPVAQSLMDAGTDLTLLTKDGCTLLHAAVMGHLPNTLRKLLVYLRTSIEGSKFKELVNFTDKDGRTALHLSASSGSVECVGVLCACEEVVVSKRDRWNRTPMDFANDECKQLLRNRECKLATVYVESPLTITNNTQSKVAIARLAVLPHHRLADVGYLVGDALSQYCNNLRGHPFYITSSNASDPPVTRGNSDTCTVTSGEGTITTSVPAKIQEVFELSRDISKPCVKHDGTTLKCERDLYHANCLATIKDVHSGISPLDLNEHSIASYRVGAFEWKPKNLDRGASVKTIFSVFKDQDGQSTKGCDICITLKGSSEQHLDQLAFELMIPVAKLKEYVKLIEHHKAVILQGPRGCGKTRLARGLAEYIKAKNGDIKTHIVHASLHPSFQRDDLFRLLHINGLLIQQTEDGRDKTRGGRKVKENFQQAHVIILDDLSLLRIPSVLAELLTCLEYRGADNPIWVNDVYGRDGSLLYPCGLYYLKHSSYFIATKTTESDTEGGESICVDQFAHISLSLLSDSCCGVLIRQLMAQLIHTQDGDLHRATQPLFRVVWWVFEVWILLNNLMKKVGLQELTFGVRHFIQCPLESNDPDKITTWLYSIWSHHLVPVITTTLLATSKLGSSPSTHTPDVKTEDVRQQLVHKLLVACPELVFEPTCPLNSKAKAKMLEQLRVGLEGPVTKRGSERKGKQKKNQKDQQRDPQSNTTAQQHSDVANRDTPPGSHQSQNSAKPPLPPQRGSMVSYEDMIRNSPRNKAKKHRSHSTKSTKSMTLDSRVNKPPPPPVDPVVLRPNSRKNKTLRKLRSKTISLFSTKESGSSTLPRLFRRGSRTSLASVSEDFTPPSTQINSPKEVKQLEDMFDLLSTANSKRFDDQRSPSPPRSSVSHHPSQNAADLDNFLDLLSSVSSKRIEEQRSPPPPPLGSKKEPSKSNGERKRIVERYMLPTGSSLRDAYKEHPSGLLGVRSPPTYSLPDLTADVEYERTQLSSSNSSHPIQRKYTNSSFSSYDSDVYYDEQSNYHHLSSSEAEVLDDENKQQQNYSKQSSISDGGDYSGSFRVRSKTYDTSTTSEPTRRRLRLRNLAIDRHIQSSSSKSTPGMTHCYPSPASPLATTAYSSPRDSPLQSGSVSKMGHYENAFESRFSASERVGTNGTSHLYDGITSNIKARSAGNILQDNDGLGNIDDFDLFRAASEGDLMQSSARDGYLDCTGTQDQVSYNGSGDCHEDSIQPVNNIPTQYNNGPAYAYQSSPEELDQPQETLQQRVSDVHTSGYGSDDYNSKYPERKRCFSASQHSNPKSNGQSLPSMDRRYSHSSMNPKSDLSSPTSSLGHGGRRSSDASSVFGSNLLHMYSASLGFDSLTRLSSSRDQLSSGRPSLSEDLTEM